MPGPGGARAGAGRPKGIHTRLDPQVVENIRGRIQADKIIQRLTALIQGEPDSDMKPHAVTAALGLLRKVVPDLTAVEISGDIQKTYVVRMPAKVENIEEWAQRYNQEPDPMITVQ